MSLETFFIGIVVALLYTEFLGLYPGGIIVPAFIALSLDQPQRVLATLLAACLTLLIYKALSAHFLLFGKRRFVLMVLVGGLLAQLWSILSPSFFSGLPELRIIGLIVPGLLANNLERQRFFPTLASLVTVVVITYILTTLLRLVT
jgi:poly-gamma-glutamate biosynthesis protein PgsC/CapC